MKSHEIVSCRNFTNGTVSRRTEIQKYTERIARRNMQRYCSTLTPACDILVRLQLRCFAQLDEIPFFIDQSPFDEATDQAMEKIICSPLPETLLAAQAEEHSDYLQVDWHQMPSARRLSDKKATGYPSATCSRQIAITKQCCGQALGNKIDLGTLYRKFLCWCRRFTDY